jgi:purine catabolism regulator
MLTVRELVDEVGLELAAGQAGGDAPVRWVHITELDDPTPWLSGGELLLTTGLRLDGAKKQRDFVKLLSAHHLAGLGLGVGFDHKALPKPMLEEAERLGFPVFEVPYELPFIAITEKAFARLVNEQYEVLRRVTSIHKRLERLVLEERGLDQLVRALAAAIGGAVAVLDSRGQTMALAAFRRELPPEALDAVRAQIQRRSVATEFAPDVPDLAGRSLALPVSTRGHGAPRAWLFGSRDAGGLGDFERLVLQQAATVVALELMRQRTMRDTERRLAGDLLAEVLDDDLGESELAARLRPFGVGARIAVLVFAEPGRDAAPSAEAELDRFLSDAGRPGLVATHEQLLCAVVDADDELEPVELAGRARRALASERPELRAAASRIWPVGELRRGFHEARCALEASALANGAAPEVASYHDLGAFQLLLSLQDEEALKLYCDSVLGPLDDANEYGDELIRSLEAYIEQNGQWERAAKRLYCHRHTLRYRIRRVEELTGRDLSSARDRIEFWLALRGRELVS